MRVLYPSIKPNKTHYLQVSELHTLYIEECGQPNGLPVVFIHGGPGGGCSEDSRRFFDPSVYRIILFDQRGAGRSQPHACLEENTTPILVEDMEHIRRFLGIEKWVLFGGSWGSTLALAYAQTHPKSVLAMILRGIFLGRQEDLAWFYQAGGASRIFPEHWQHFIAPIPMTEREDLIGAYYRQLTSDDEILRMSAAKHWSEWEGKCATLSPNKNVVEKMTHPHTAMSLARIEAHYFQHQLFLTENQLLHNARQLTSIPGILIHGRYDMICPLDNAYDLHQAWPGSELQIIADAGHTSSEPGITDALIHATDRVGKLYNYSNG